MLKVCANPVSTAAPARAVRAAYVSQERNETFSCPDLVCLGPSGPFETVRPGGPAPGGSSQSPLEAPTEISTVPSKPKTSSQFCLNPNTGTLTVLDDSPLPFVPASMAEAAVYRPQADREAQEVGFLIRFYASQSEVRRPH